MRQAEGTGLVTEQASGLCHFCRFSQGWLNRQTHDTRIYSIVLVGLFLITELVPFFTGLDHQVRRARPMHKPAIRERSGRS